MGRLVSFVVVSLLLVACSGGSESGSSVSDDTSLADKITRELEALGCRFSEDSETDYTYYGEMRTVNVTSVDCNPGLRPHLDALKDLETRGEDTVFTRIPIYRKSLETIARIKSSFQNYLDATAKLEHRSTYSCRRRAVSQLLSGKLSEIDTYLQDAKKLDEDRVQTAFTKDIYPRLKSFSVSRAQLEEARKDLQTLKYVELSSDSEFSEVQLSQRSLRNFSLNDFREEGEKVRQYGLAAKAHFTNYLIPVLSPELSSEIESGELREVSAFSLDEMIRITQEQTDEKRMLMHLDRDNSKKSVELVKTLRSCLDIVLKSEKLPQLMQYSALSNELISQGIATLGDMAGVDTEGSIPAVNPAVAHRLVDQDPKAVLSKWEETVQLLLEIKASEYDIFSETNADFRKFAVGIQKLVKELKPLELETGEDLYYHLARISMRRLSTQLEEDARFLRTHGIKLELPTSIDAGLLQGGTSLSSPEEKERAFFAVARYVACLRLLLGWQESLILAADKTGGDEAAQIKKEARETASQVQKLLKSFDEIQPYFLKQHFGSASDAVNEGINSIRNSLHQSLTHPPEAEENEAPANPLLLLPEDRTARALGKLLKHSPS